VTPKNGPWLLHAVLCDRVQQHSDGTSDILGI